MASSCHAPPLCHGVISDDSSHNKSLHGSIAEQKDDRSLERSSHLVRADRGGGDKKSRCSLYSTVRPHPFPESFQPLFDGLVFGVAATSFLQRGQKGCRCTSAPPYKFSFGPVLEVVLSGSCIFANG